MTRTPTSTKRPAAASVTLSQPPPLSRRELLRLELLTTVDSLYRRRADLVSEGFIADYVALNWLEWHGGALRLTTTGENMCLQMRAGLA